MYYLVLLLFASFKLLQADNSSVYTENVDPVHETSHEDTQLLPSATVSEADGAHAQFRGIDGATKEPDNLSTDIIGHGYEEQGRDLSSRRSIEEIDDEAVENDSDETDDEEMEDDYDEPPSIDELVDSIQRQDVHHVEYLIQEGAPLDDISTPRLIEAAVDVDSAAIINLLMAYNPSIELSQSLMDTAIRGAKFNAANALQLYISPSKVERDTAAKTTLKRQKQVVSTSAEGESRPPEKKVRFDIASSLPNTGDSKEDIYKSEEEGAPVDISTEEAVQAKKLCDAIVRGNTAEIDQALLNGADPLYLITVSDTADDSRIGKTALGEAMRIGGRMSPTYRYLNERANYGDLTTTTLSQFLENINLIDPLADAIKENDPELVDRLIHQGHPVSPEETDNAEQIPLIVAILEASVVIVELLLEAGAPVTFLIYGSQTPYMYAKKRMENQEEIMALIDDAAKRNTLTYVDNSLNEGGTSILPQPLKNINSIDPLVVAIKENDVDLVKRLICQWQHVPSEETDSAQQVPLIVAISEANVVIVKLLLDAGAAVTFLVGSTHTPYMYARQRMENQQKIMSLIDEAAKRSTVTFVDHRMKKYSTRRLETETLNLGT